MAEEKLKKLEEKLKEELKCSICLDTFTSPKILECHHIFCQECLSRLVRTNNRIICPSCRQHTNVPASGASGLSAALHISGLVDILELFSTDVLCCSEVEHSTKEAELYCKTCEELICCRCAIRRGKHCRHNYFELSGGYRYLNSKRTGLQERLKMVEGALIGSKKRLERKISQCTLGSIQRQEHGRRKKKKEKARIQGVQNQRQLVLKDLKCLQSQINKLFTDMASCQTLIKESDESICLKEKNTALKKAEGALYKVRPEAFKLCQKIAEIQELVFADPSKCYATGKGLNHAKVNQENSFYLRILSSTGKPCNRASVNCMVVAVCGSVVPHTFRRMDWDLYKITYKPDDDQAELKIVVSVDGEEIPGSPFNVSCTNRKFYQDWDIFQLERDDLYNRAGVCVALLLIFCCFIVYKLVG